MPARSMAAKPVDMMSLAKSACRSSSEAGTIVEEKSAPPSRNASPWPPNSRFIGAPCVEQTCGSSSMQRAQLPHPVRHAATMRSPRFSVSTPSPTASTMPIDSCPIGMPGGIMSNSSTMWMSDPQIVDSVVRHQHLARSRIGKREFGPGDLAGTIFETGVNVRHGRHFAAARAALKRSNAGGRECGVSRPFQRESRAVAAQETLVKTPCSA